MLITKVGFAAVAFILHSGVLGRPERICALKGTSVNLSCSEEHDPAPKWFILEGDKWTEVSGNRAGIKYNISKGNKLTLSVMDVNKEDKKAYCCNNNPTNCPKDREDLIELLVTDLQVKVLPTTDGQTVTLQCSTTCPLSEKPAAYIWYKNQELLYQDWSPWYQELVPGEPVDSYSCAIQGLGHLPAPAVRVESVSPSCFTVSYAKGKLCLYNQTRVKGPCSNTYPTEMHVVKKTEDESHVSLSCKTSCPPTTTQWYQNRELEETIGKIPSTSQDNFMCAVKGNKHLQSAEVCGGNGSCTTINYVKTRICALEGSSVNISSEYSYPSWSTEINSPRWSRIIWNGTKEEKVNLKEPAGYSEHHEGKKEDNQKKIHTLTITSVNQTDSAEYRLRLQGDEKSQKPGVILIVTDVKVNVSPSAEVREGGRVRLTCSTHCPLTHNKNYIWFLNHQLLSEHQNKQLLLDPVRTHHAGNYSCSVSTQRHIRSPEETLVVQSSSFQWRWAAAAGAGAAVLLLITLSVICWIRGSRKQRKNTVLHLEETNPGHVYEEIKDHPTEQTECCYYSSVPLPQAEEDPLYNTVQPHEPQQASHSPYAVVSLSNRSA